MTRLVACLIPTLPIVLALPAHASADDWLFLSDAPIFVDARDAVSWDAGQSIGAGGDVALQVIRAQVRIAQPALPAYEPGTA